MELKKNPKANVGRNSSLYFAIGLALMLFFTNYAINYKTYDKVAEVEEYSLEVEEEIEEEIPIIQNLLAPPPPPPPPPPPAPTEVLEVVEDEAEVIEDIIESTETDEEEVIPDEVEDIEEVETVEAAPVEVPFSVIENVPVFPGCEKGNNAKKKQCMAQKISKFVNRKFDKELAQDNDLTGRQRVMILFKIDKTGSVVDVQARAKHPALVEEAKRVINSLPKMQPGKQRGKAVAVPYSLPLVFLVE